MNKEECREGHTVHSLPNLLNHEIHHIQDSNTYPKMSTHCMMYFLEGYMLMDCYVNIGLPC